MTEKKKRKGGKKKVSLEKRARSDYKWAKVLGWKIDDLEKRVEKIESAIKLICEKLKISSGEADG